MSRFTVNIIKMILIMCSMSLSFVGCSKKDDTIKEIQKEGVLKVLVAENAGAYAEKISSDVWEGVEIDIIKEVANNLGVKTEFISTPKKGVTSVFSRAKVHIAIGRIPDSTNLRYTYSPSISYGMGRILTVTKRGVYFPNLNSLTNSVVGVTGEISETASIKLHGISGIKINEYSDEDIGVIEEAVRSGDLTAFLCYDNKILDFIRIPDLQIQDLFGIEQEQYVAVCKKRARGLVQEINSVVTRMSESGQLSELHNKYSD